jgi:hypothetical protein
MNVSSFPSSNALIRELESIIDLGPEERPSGAPESLEFYAAPPGHGWFLVRDSASDHVFVRQEESAPSGGLTRDFELSEFLDESGPAQVALTKLIGTLVSGTRG